MKSLSSLPPGLFSRYYRSQSEVVKDNIRKAVGLGESFFATLQSTDNQVVTKPREK